MKYRRHIRLKEYDYKSPNWYFVTVCTKNRKELFMAKVSEKYGDLLSENITKIVTAGPWPANNKRNTNIVEQKLKILEKKFPAEIDFYCIMPDHVHLIIELLARQGRAATEKTATEKTATEKTATEKTATEKTATEKTISLSWIINALKGWCSRDIGYSIWQANFYEHIIRSESSLDRIRNYILNNPLAEYQSIPWKQLDT